MIITSSVLRASLVIYHSFAQRALISRRIFNYSGPYCYKTGHEEVMEVWTDLCIVLHNCTKLEIILLKRVCHSLTRLRLYFRMWFNAEQKPWGLAKSWIPRENGLCWLRLVHFLKKQDCVYLDWAIWYSIFLPMQVRTTCTIKLCAFL